MYGVQLFFVISGFIMVYITNERAPTPAKFMANRIVRIVPLYWAMTLLVFAVALIAPHLLKSTRADPAELIQSLLFITFVKEGNLVRPTLFQGWTLNLEMLFYAAFALTLFLPNQWLRVGILIGAICAAVAFGEIMRPLPPVAAFYTLPLLLCFALGMVLGLLYPRVGPGVIAASVLFLLATIGFGHISSPDALINRLQPIAFSFVVVTVALALEARHIAVTWQPALLLGAASYALYLVHPFVAIATSKAARHLGLLEGPALVLTVAFATFAMITAGLLAHLFVEKPLDRVARRLMGWSSQGKVGRQRG